MNQIQQQTITIEGKTYLSEDFRSENTPAFASKSDFHNQLYLFLKDWFSDQSTLIVYSSGSTGIPKAMLVEKQRMMESAKLTCAHLSLKKGDAALLCMSLDYIGGKMMVVRTLVASLNLYAIAPSGNPLKELAIPFQFAAMIPLQVFNSLQTETERKCLAEIENLIIGGGSIDPQLQEAIKLFPNNIYSTYGMTETLSHIALRKLNGAEASELYTPFSSVNLSLSEDNALIIDAPLVASEKLYTNDIVEMHNDGRFRIIGRKDNIINSGGIKIQTEEVEALLKPFIQSSFAISSLPDSKFGEIVVLAVTKDINEALIRETLPQYYIPKKIIKLDSIPQTETGKINRVGLKELLLNKEQSI